MMYMPDAVRAAIELMDVDPIALKHRNAFNVTSVNVTPEELADADGVDRLAHGLFGDDHGAAQH